MAKKIAKKKTVTKKAKSKKLTPKARKSHGIERRRHHRRAVLDTFHMFLCVKKHGLAKFYLRDVSESGFAFKVEETNDFNKNDIHECRFFINPGLSLILKFRVAHLQQDPLSKAVRIGAEIVQMDSVTKAAFMAFVRLLDKLGDVNDLHHHVPL